MSLEGQNAGDRRVPAPTSEHQLTEWVAANFRTEIDQIQRTHPQAPKEQILQYENAKLHKQGYPNLDIVDFGNGHLVTADSRDHRRNVHDWGPGGSPPRQFNDQGRPGNEQHLLYNGDHRTIHRDHSGHVDGIVDKDKNGKTVGSIEKNQDGTFTRYDANHQPIEKVKDLHVTKHGAVEYTRENGDHVYQHVTPDGKTFRETTPAAGGQAKHEQVDPHAERGRARPSPAERPQPGPLSAEALNSLTREQKQALKEWAAKFLADTATPNAQTQGPELSQDPKLQAIQKQVMQLYRGESVDAQGHHSRPEDARRFAEAIQRQLTDQSGR